MSEDVTLDEFVGTENQKSSNLELGPIEVVIPDKWDSRELSTVFDLITGNNYTGDYLSDEDNSGRIFLTLKSVNKCGGFNWDSMKYYTGEVNGREVVEPGELLIANTDVTQDGDIVGYSIRVPDFDSEKEIAASMDLSILRPTSDIVNLPYIEYLLQTDYIHSRMRAFSAGSTVLHLNTDLVESLLLPLPPVPEQRKIATVLYTVDGMIEKTEEIERQLHRVKKGAKQRLFTYGLNNEETQSHHIGDFPESWEFDKISDLAEIERGNTPRTSHDEYYGRDITWVTPDDLSDLNEDGNGKYISDSGRELTPEGVESSSLTVVEPDSVMFTSRSYGIGRTAICTVPAATNQGITAFDCGESLDTEFFYYYLNYIKDYVISLSGGSTFPEISKSATGNIDVPVPDID
ncbi:restriction endonuclease subunit S, partial [Halorubrum ezzemoulense]|uniref:restriction endonuclease subunit S n=1 Tax=Halorubrum ezzemoulense TaxID=337243 RepID=UPI00232FFDFE